MDLMPTLRLADPETASRYPLTVAGAADWSRDDHGWSLTLPLPAQAAGTILVPSLAFPANASTSSTTTDGDSTHRHRWTLRAGPSRYRLPRVPGDPPRQASAAEPERERAVSTHIDCFRIHRPLAAPSLLLQTNATGAPERYLVTVSSRPFTMAAPAVPGRRACAPPPPARSQMTAPAAIAERICSPTCVSMVLDGWQRTHDWLGLVAECLDPGTGMYGVWPLALRAAAARGSIGAVEVFAGWEDPLAVLDRGIPLVTSIRFGPGGLPGAPLPETAGHLVVMFEAGADAIHVCDPAAPPGKVRRCYPAEAFSGAWLRHRGAAYILPP